MKHSTVRWPWVWQEFSAWIERREAARRRCKMCDKLSGESPDWDEQQRAIQRIVERDLADSKGPK